MLQIMIFVLGLGLFALSFVVVLNSLEQSSLLYPGSNVRFLATMPIALLLLAICPWLVSWPPEFSVIKTIELIAVLSTYVIYSAWVESRYRGGLAKRAMKAVVSDKSGKPITFKHALRRNLYKLLLLPLAPLSLYIMIKDFRRQTLHDKLAGTFVMWSPDVIREKKPETQYHVEIR